MLGPQVNTNQIVGRLFEGIHDLWIETFPGILADRAIGFVEGDGFARPTKVDQFVEALGEVHNPCFKCDLACSKPCLPGSVKALAFCPLDLGGCDKGLGVQQIGERLSYPRPVSACV